MVNRSLEELKTGVEEQGYEMGKAYLAIDFFYLHLLLPFSLLGLLDDIYQGTGKVEVDEYGWEKDWCGCFEDIYWMLLIQASHTVLVHPVHPWLIVVHAM